MQPGDLVRVRIPSKLIRSFFVRNKIRMYVTGRISTIESISPKIIIKNITPIKDLTEYDLEPVELNTMYVRKEKLTPEMDAAYVKAKKESRKIALQRTQKAWYQDKKYEIKERKILKALALERKNTDISSQNKTIKS